MNEIDEHWLQGSIGEKSGIFPVSYVNKDTSLQHSNQASTHGTFREQPLLFINHNNNGLMKELVVTITMRIMEMMIMIVIIVLVVIQIIL